MHGSTLIDWPAYAKARAELGAGFVRILGYFREDGVKSVAAKMTSLSAKPAASSARGAHQDAHWLDDAAVDPADDAACRFRSTADGHRYFL